MMEDLRLTAIYLVTQTNTGHLIHMWDELDNFYELLDCGCIEVVDTNIEGVLMVIDEEGKLRHKRINELATSLYPYNYADTIVGNAILVGDDDCEFRSLTHDEIRAVEQALHREVTPIDK